MKVSCEDLMWISQINENPNFTAEDIICIETLHETSTDPKKIRVWFRK